mmetsp:Transcript_9886/g.28036  ORF Transcript_9886/g.28036 Transcript_9886/m.28036 type:complete len:466 (-) Transcript_9886:797-2194(-)
MHAAAQRQHAVAEPPPHLPHLRIVVQPDVLERPERVRGHHLRPLVAVVPRRVPAGEDVREGAQEAVLLQRQLVRAVLLGHAALHVEDALVAGRVVPRVQLHVEHAEGELPARHHAGVVRLLRAQLLEVLLRQRLAGLVVPGEAVHRRLVVAPVLHELRRQLDGVPLDPVDAGDVAHGGPGQHVLEAVSGLVEQRLDLAERHQRRRVAHRRAAVAREVGHGDVAPARLGPADAHVHPGAAALVGRPRVRVQVERRDVLVGLVVVDGEEAHVVVPHLGLPIGGPDADPEDALDEAEQAVQNLLELEVGAQLLLLQLELGLLVTLGPERDVPRLQLVDAGLRVLVAAVLARVRGDRLQLLASGRQRLFQDEVGQLAHGLDVGRHLGRQAALGVVAESQQGRRLRAQGQDLVDERDVVACIVGVSVVGVGIVVAIFLVGCSCEVSHVHGLTGGAVGNVLHGGQVRRTIQ